MATTVQKPEAPPDASEWPLVLRLRPAIDLTEDQFFKFCQLNRELRIERNAEGALLIMPPTGGGSGNRNAEITRQLGNWARQDGTGKTFDSSTGFQLPNTAVRAPDAAWLPRERWEQLSPAEREKFVPLCPVFVIELRSPIDRLRDVHDTMREYIANGARLGWLLDPKPRRVYVYRPDARVERLDNPQSISGDPVLPSFVLNLREIW